MYNQPNNEEIIAEICEAEKYLKSLIARLLNHNATTNTLGMVVEALRLLGNCYIQDDCNHGIAMPMPMNISVNRRYEIPEVIREAILQGVDEAIRNYKSTETES